MRNARKRSFKRNYKNVSPSVKKYVQKAIAKNVETKFVNNTLIASPTDYRSIGNTWLETDLTNIAQGTGIAQRIGHEIKLKGFNYRGTLVGGQSNLATDDNRNTVRIVLGIWDATSSTPLTSNGATIDSYIAKDTTVSKGLVKKLYDSVIELQTPGRDSTGYLPAMKQLRKFIKLNKHFIRYYGSGSTNDNHKLILSMITDSAAPSHPGFVNGYVTVFFEDA